MNSDVSFGRDRGNEPINVWEFRLRGQRLPEKKEDWADSGLYEFWNIRFCSLVPVGMKKTVLLLSDYKRVFFKLSADIKFMPINLDLVPDFDDFLPPIRQV